MSPVLFTDKSIVKKMLSPLRQRLILKQVTFSLNLGKGPGEPHKVLPEQLV